MTPRPGLKRPSSPSCIINNVLCGSIKGLWLGKRKSGEGGGEIISIRAVSSTGIKYMQQRRVKITNGVLRSSLQKND
jgi:hypothetical protein